MNAIVEKIKNVVIELEKERGPLLVCSLFLRGDPLERWDMVVSATWLSSSDLNSYQLISSKVQDALDGQELLQFSRIIILDQNDPAILFLQDTFSITNGKIEEISSDLLSSRFGFTIKKAYLLRCQKQQ